MTPTWSAGMCGFVNYTFIIYRRHKARRKEMREKSCILYIFKSSINNNYFHNILCFCESHVHLYITVGVNKNETLSPGCINFKNLCAHQEKEVQRIPKQPQLAKLR